MIDLEPVRESLLAFAERARAALVATVRVSVPSVIRRCALHDEVIVTVGIDGPHVVGASDRAACGVFDRILVQRGEDDDTAQAACPICGGTGVCPDCERPCECVGSRMT